MNLDYKKVFHVIIIPALLGIGFLFGHFSCNNNEGAITSIRLVPDTNKQKQIDSLKEHSNKLSDSLAVVNYQLNQVDSQRAVVSEKFQVRYKLVEIENSDELYKQNRVWLNPLSSPSASLRTLTGKRYEYDSLDNLSLAKKHVEYDFLKKDRALLLQNDSLKDSKIKLLTYSLSDANQIISLQGDQIHQLTSTPVPVVKGGHGWYVDVGGAIIFTLFGYGLRTITHK